jgi:serine/threonine protein kinase
LKGEVDFLAELTIINRLRHKHLVRLLGWCNKNGKLLLVYEYMPNGSLDKHLFQAENESALSWTLRYKIISGVASALHYLHNEYDQKVVHRDLKASNIMLDSNFNARLGDFGLARAIDNEKTSYAEAEGVLGTVGYIAPECFHTGKATQHSDVYAFGAVLLEMVSGQRPGARIGGFHVLVDWVWSLYREGNLLRAVDERLGSDYVAEEAERILLLGLACSQPMANERPKTQAIVQILSGLLAVPEVPHHKPPFVWPAMGPLDDYSGAFTADTTSINTSQFGAFGSEYSPEEYTGYSDQHSLV